MSKTEVKYCPFCGKKNGYRFERFRRFFGIEFYHKKFFHCINCGIDIIVEVENE